MTKKMRLRKISQLMGESDSNAGNARLIKLIRADNCKNGAVRFFRSFPLVWW